MNVLDRCWSHVGRRGGPQLVSLQPPDGRSRNCLGSEGRAIHELMHTLGLFHEQARADRDTYVRVHEDNICKGYKKNFKKQSLENTTYAFEYDYNSIMHYGKYFFSKKRGKPTITAKLGKKVRLGQRRAMSKTDCLKVNHLYNCLKSRRYYTLCNVLGI
ncbi:hypothetical protein PR048_010185 [Dryococelus australis]|uniref:Metalloendopeptidase n=1 Tax=Dryococelus australis TaxID=614101 RepID=A0ABQ9I2S9_9NEOP|nr:hypothetical protein PR048_010185 [Dryococelus australis]